MHRLGLPRQFPAERELVAGPRIEPAVAGHLRRVRSRRAADAMHHVVPGEPGVPAVGEAPATKSEGAGRAGRTADPGGARGGADTVRAGSPRTARPRAPRG